MEQQKLPNATLALVLSIVSLPLCFCYGLGLILAIVSLILGKKAMNKFNADPELYTGKGQAQAGFIISIVSIVLNLVYLGFVIYIISVVGLDTLMNDPQGAQEAILETFGQ